MDRLKFYEEVYHIVSQIPPGKVLTYGEIARLTGCPQYSRRVGQALRQAPAHRHLPCHRVVNSQGRTAPGWPEQHTLLKEEGVTFRANGCVDIALHGWRIADEEETKMHPFRTSVAHIALPRKFTYPFHYTPHPLCITAATEVQAYLAAQAEWQTELEQGKMFGVLVVQSPSGDLGYLAAFSGILAGKNRHAFFVPPVYDLLQPQGFFKVEEENISALNRQIEQWQQHPAYLDLLRQTEEARKQSAHQIAEAKAVAKVAKEARQQRRLTACLDEAEQAALIRESQFQKAELKRLERSWEARIHQLQSQADAFTRQIEAGKAERKARSAALQHKLFEQFNLLNARGEVKDLCRIFEQTVQKEPPAGAGECAAPKLLQYAYLHQLKPIAMAEFWWGRSPKAEIRHHGHYYPACKGKCEPILSHMLQGLKVDDNPLQQDHHPDFMPEIVYEDDYLLVVNKPAGMLSVPGKGTVKSMYHHIRLLYPQATGPLVVHRLDMATSGLLLIAKTKEIHQHLQAQFKSRSIQKRYTALLDGVIPSDEGTIELPLCANPLDRPRQMVSYEHGKPALTRYRVLQRTEGNTLVAFYPLTGRTHQLRIHAAHPSGLGCPIKGDELYGRQKADRLYLHAEWLEFTHPVTGKRIAVEKKPDFSLQPAPVAPLM